MTIRRSSMSFARLTSRAVVSAVVLLGSVLVGCASNDRGLAPVPPPQKPPVATAPERFDPKASARAHTQLAGSYLELGNLSVALEEARIAIQADAEYAPAHNIMGLVQMGLKEPARAHESFQRALRIDARDPDTNHNFGWFLCQMQREREAIKYFETAARNPLYATPAKSHTAAASCLIKTGELQQATEQINTALNFFPLYVPALVTAARLQLERGDVPQARELMARYTALTEPSAEALLVAIRIEQRRGDKVGEASYATQLRRRFPGSPEFQEYLRGRTQ